MYTVVGQILPGGKPHKNWQAVDNACPSHLAVARFKFLSGHRAIALLLVLSVGGETILVLVVVATGMDIVPWPRSSTRPYCK